MRIKLEFGLHQINLILDTSKRWNITLYYNKNNMQMYTSQSADSLNKRTNEKTKTIINYLGDVARIKCTQCVQK